jgi:hypothetical protein
MNNYLQKKSYKSEEIKPQVLTHLTSSEKLESRFSEVMLPQHEQI